MNNAILSDRLAWASNIVARKIGVTASVYRPNGLLDPLSPENRYIRLSAVFGPIRGSPDEPCGYGNALRRGYFDSAYTRVGDYLVQGREVHFIASQGPLQSPLCVRTNRTLTIRRPNVPGPGGEIGYGGITAERSTIIMGAWPASVLGIAMGGRAEADLPADTAITQWTILLPSCAAGTIKNGDWILDEHGDQLNVFAAELSEMGWRIMARQATT